MANSVINEILRQGRNQPRRYVLAALATGKVESGFRNLPGGDADSQGWRQERASLYRNPRNLKASVRRFYSEAAQHDRGQGIGELAADVQRPAAQYRGRYAQVLPEAKQIFRGGGAVSGGGGARLKLAPGNATNIAGLLSSLGVGERQRPAATPPAAPAFSATAATPQGSQPIDTSGIEQAGTDYKTALAKLQEITESQQAAGIQIERGGGGTGSGGGAGAPVAGALKELIWRGPGAQTVKDGERVSAGTFSGHTDHVHVAGRQKSMVTLGKLAQKMGLRVSENPAFDPVDPVHVEGSYHYGRGKDRAIDVSGDTRLMKKFAKRVARSYGV